MYRIYKRLLFILVLEYFSNLKTIYFVDASSSPDVTRSQTPSLDQPNPSRFSRPTSFGDDDAWTVFDPDTASPCIKLQGKIEFKVVTTDLNNFQGTDWISVPETAMATGHCHSLYNDYQDIRLSWEEYELIDIFGNQEDDSAFSLQHTSYSSYSIYFGFATSWESEFSDLAINEDEFALNSVTIVVEKDGPDQNENHPISYSVSDFVAFSTPKNRTFSCSNVQFLSGDLEMKISDLRIQAFNFNEMDFDEMFECEADKPQPWNDKTVLEHVVHAMGWIFISFFALCLFGVILVLLVGGFNKRHDIMAIGYKFVGTNGNQSSEA